VYCAGFEFQHRAERGNSPSAEYPLLLADGMGDLPAIAEMPGHGIRPLKVQAKV
jgi:hypothetical protein